MHHLELNDEERTELAHLLQHTVSQLRIEIGHTDHRDFREMLRHRLDVVEGLLHRVEERDVVVSR